MAEARTRRAIHAPRHADPGMLDALPWAWRSDPLDALGFRFRVRALDPALGAALADIVGALARPAGGAGESDDTAEEVWYSVFDRGPARRRYTLYRGNDRLVCAQTPDQAGRWFTMDLNARTVEHARRSHVVLHAAAAELDGAGVVLCAPMESGKSTLVAGLVERGFRYLTDEAVAVSPDDGWLEPYPKAIGIDRGAWPILPELDPRLDEDIARWFTGQWHVAPTAIRPDAVAPRTPLRVCVAPRYVAGADTTVEHISRGAMLLELFRNSFNAADDPARALRLLATALRSASCYRLVVGDLDAACATVRTLLPTPVPTSGGGTHD